MAATTGNSGARLELRVSARGREEEHDVIVVGPANERVSVLAAALAERLGEDPERASVWCVRRGEQLSREQSLEGAGVRWGDRLLLIPPISEPTRVGGTARVELVVSGGPCAGERFELGEGNYRIGRDADMDVRIADQSLSRHHLNLVVTADAVQAADADSRNGTALDGRGLVPGQFREIRERDQLELGRSLVRIRPLGGRRDHGVPLRGGRLEFNRPPRVNPPVEPFASELGSPPSRRRRGRLPLAASLVPLGAGVLLFVLLKSPVMLAIAGLSPLMAISTYLSDRRGGRKSFARESSDFRQALAAGLQALDAAIAEEAVTRRAESPDAPSLFSRLDQIEASLWERRPADPDFLELRVGVADLRLAAHSQSGRVATRRSVPRPPRRLTAGRSSQPSHSPSTWRVSGSSD